MPTRTDRCRKLRCAQRSLWERAVAVGGKSNWSPAYLGRAVGLRAVRVGRGLSQLAFRPETPGGTIFAKVRVVGTVTAVVLLALRKRRNGPGLGRTLSLLQHADAPAGHAVSAATFLCDASAGERDTIPEVARVAGTCGREHDEDFHACDEETGAGAGESAGLLAAMPFGSSNVESQRDSGLQPRVARSSQPRAGGHNPVGVATRCGTRA